MVNIHREFAFKFKSKHSTIIAVSQYLNSAVFCNFVLGSAPMPSMFLGLFVMLLHKLPQCYYFFYFLLATFRQRGEEILKRNKILLICEDWPLVGINNACNCGKNTCCMSQNRLQV